MFISLFISSPVVGADQYTDTQVINAFGFTPTIVTQSSSDPSAAKQRNGIGSQFYRLDVSDIGVREFTKIGIHSQSNNTIVYYSSLKLEIKVNYYSVYDLNIMNIVPNQPTSSLMIQLHTYRMGSDPGTRSYLYHRWRSVSMYPQQIWYGAGFDLGMSFTSLDSWAKSFNWNNYNVSVASTSVVFNKLSAEAATVGEVGAYVDTMYRSSSPSSQLTESVSKDSIPSSGLGFSTAEGGKSTVNGIFPSNYDWQVVQPIQEITHQQDSKDPATGTFYLNSNNSANAYVPMLLSPKINIYRQYMTLKSCAEMDIDVEAAGLLTYGGYAGVEYTSPVVSKTISRDLGAHVYNYNIQQTFLIDTTLFSTVVFDIPIKNATLSDPDLRKGDVIIDTSLSGDSAEVIFTLSRLESIFGRIGSILVIIGIVAVVLVVAYFSLKRTVFKKVLGR